MIAKIQEETFGIIWMMWLPRFISRHQCIIIIVGPHAPSESYWELMLKSNITSIEVFGQKQSLGSKYLWYSKMYRYSCCCFFFDIRIRINGWTSMIPIIGLSNATKIYLFRFHIRNERGINGKSVHFNKCIEPLTLLILNSGEIRFPICQKWKE